MAERGPLISAPLHCSVRLLWFDSVPLDFWHQHLVTPLGDLIPVNVPKSWNLGTHQSESEDRHHGYS